MRFNTFGYILVYNNEMTFIDKKYYAGNDGQSKILTYKFSNL